MTEATSVCPEQGEGGPFKFDPATWRVRRYGGGPYHHGFRQCSFCGSLHPDDVIALVKSGVPIERTDKRYKCYINLPNKVVGQRVCNGSTSGLTFEQHPKTLRERLFGKVWAPGGKASLKERLTGSYNRKTYGSGPSTASAKVYMYHFSHPYIDELNAAIQAQKHA